MLLKCQKQKLFFKENDALFPGWATVQQMHTRPNQTKAVSDGRNFKHTGQEGQKCVGTACNRIQWPLVSQTAWRAPTQKFNPNIATWEVAVAESPDRLGVEIIH